MKANSSTATATPTAKPTTGPTAKPRPLPRVRELKCSYDASTQTLEWSWLRPSREFVDVEYQLRAKRVGGKRRGWSSNGLATTYDYKNVRPGAYMLQVRICVASDCGKERTKKHVVRASQPTRRLLVV